MHVAHRVRHRQDSLLADERLADDVGEEARRRLVGSTWPHADRRQPDADAIDEALAAVVRQQQLGDLLLGTVAGERGVEIFLRNGLGEGRAEDRDRRGEDQPWQIASGGVGSPDRFQQMPHAVHVDTITLVEILFGFARDDGRQMIDDVRAGGDQTVDLRPCRKIADLQDGLAVEASGPLRGDDVGKQERRDGATRPPKQGVA